MFRPIAWVRSLKTIPIAFFASLKYSRGLTRTKAPVGQFSWHEYAAVFAPSGLSEVFSHRLHLIASKLSVAVTGSGFFGGARLSNFLSVPSIPSGSAIGLLRATIEIAL